MDTGDVPDTVVEPARPEPPAGGTAPVQADLLAAVEADLAAVERALASLDDGSYGRCGVCEAGVADDRLAADPTTTRCDEHVGVAAGGVTAP